MGLISKISNLSEVQGLMINEEEYSRVQNWLNAYRGDADWQHYTWMDNYGVDHSEKRMTLNMPKTVAHEMASLVFNNKCLINVTPKTDKAKDKTAPEDLDNPAHLFVQQVLEDNYFYHNAQRYLEYMFATGGMVIRGYVRDGKVKLRFATADAFIPISEDANGVTECVIVDTFKKSGAYYTFLEWHLEEDENYVIKNELYKSTNSDGSDIGIKVKLDEVYKGLKDETRYSKSQYTVPTFVYVKPNIANNINLTSPMGIPLIANASDTLKQLDLLYDMLFQENEMGRRRVNIPSSMIKLKLNQETGEMKRQVDWRDRAYQVYKSDGVENAKPDDITLPLRDEEMLSAINGLLNILAGQTGFSSGTFTMAQSGEMKTATEVISENSKTHKSKETHETLIGDALKRVVQMVVELGKNSSSEYEGPTDINVSINFDDSVAKDRNQDLDYYMQATNNQQLMPLVEAVKRFNGITDAEAEDYVQRIKEENADEGNIEDVLGNEEVDDNADTGAIKPKNAK